MIKYLSITAFIILLAAIESFGLPWLGLFGISLPLAMVGLAVGSLILPRMWLPWLAVIVGLVLDMPSLAPIGMWTAYCLIVIWFFDRLNRSTNGRLQRPWWHLAAATLVAVALAPLYGTVLSQEQVVLDPGLGLYMAYRLMVILPVALMTMWLVHRRQAR